MNEIFTVYIKATWCRDELGWKQPLEKEDSTWIDSYWTNENDAIAEAQRIWEDDATDEFIEELIVFGRKLNVAGKGMNTWNDSVDRIVKRWE